MRRWLNTFAIYLGAAIVGAIVIFLSAACWTEPCQ